nr:hypothetical protein [Tanacetum cinerariifolium]
MQEATEKTQGHAAKEEGKEVRKEKRSNSLRFKRLRRVGTAQRMESSTDTVMGRVNQQDVNAATKGVSTVEPTVFDDKEVTMTMAQTLIMLKAEKAKLLDEQIAQKRHDEEVKKAAARDKQERMVWKELKKYQNLKKKPISIAQARKNMIIYLKNIAGYKMEHFRGMTYDKLSPIFKREYKKVQTLFKPDNDVEEPNNKRVTDEALLQESFKKLRVIEVSELKVEALQVKYSIIDWKIHTEGSRTYWKIIRVGGITKERPLPGLSIGGIPIEDQSLKKLEDKVPLPREPLWGLNQFETQLVSMEVVLEDLQETLLDNSSPLEYLKCFLPSDPSPPHVPGM